MPTSRPKISRGLGPQPVIYRSSSLQRNDPELVANANPESIARSRAIQNANRRADAVRDSCRTETPDSEPTPLGNDEQANAKKYERRLKMNRKSAAASRLRREAYTKALEVELLSIEGQYEHLIKELEKERNLNKMLSGTNAVAQGAIEPIEQDESQMGQTSTEQDSTNLTPQASTPPLFPITQDQTTPPNISEVDTNGFEFATIQNVFTTPNQQMLPIAMDLDHFLNPHPSRELTEERLEPLLNEYPTGNLPMSVAEAYSVGNAIPDCFLVDGQVPISGQDNQDSLL